VRADKASICGFSRIGPEAVRFFDAIDFGVLGASDVRIAGESGHPRVLSALPLMTQSRHPQVFHVAVSKHSFESIRCRLLKAGGEHATARFSRVDPQFGVCDFIRLTSALSGVCCGGAATRPKQTFARVKFKLAFSRNCDATNST